MKDSKQIIAWQRLEGLLILLVAAFYFADMGINLGGGNTLLFLAGFLAVDISMLGYLYNERVGALTYNAAHSLVLPLFLMLLALPSDEVLLVKISLVWLAHIGLDRIFGYGLKYDDGFKHTHLGQIGKK